MKMQEITIPEKVKEIGKRDRNIIAVILFGSSLKGKGRDIDLCFIMEPELSKRKLLEKRIEYAGILGDRFDVQIFQMLPLYIRIRVLKEGKIVFLRDEDKLYEIAFRTVRDFEYFRKYYEEYLRGVENV